jgi:inorganic triphosphatase YgiF
MTKNLNMEIEAKFTVPNAHTVKLLESLGTVGEFSLKAPEGLKMRDTFYDTSASTLINARHVLRVRRRSDGKTFLTLKAPTETLGAVHRRPETEVELDLARVPKTVSRATLPRGIYKRIAPLVGDSILYPLFSITQIRHIRVLKKGRRVIGEWSVDRVEFRAGARQNVFYELEIELKKSGSERELEEILAVLRKQIKLKPQRRSKFERALEFYRTE